MSKITIKELEALAPTDHNRIIREEGGLVGKVRAGVRGVTVLFRYEFWLEGVKRDHRLGSWPKKALAAMRAERDRVRVVVADGIDPTAAKKAERIEKQKAVEATLAQAEQERSQRLTFKDLFDAWVTDGVARKDGNAELKRSFGADILPGLGSIELRHLTEHHVRATIKKMIARGVARSADVAFNNIVQMLHWGEKRQPWRGLLINGNPADLVNINTLLPDDYEEERDRVLSPAELLELAEIFSRLREEYEAAPAGTKYDAIRPMKRETELALWICLGTLCRIGELLQAEWKHVDLTAGTWFIPKANVKGRRTQKQDHMVFLSSFTKRQLSELKELTGKSQWLFPARNKLGDETHVCLKSVSKQVGDRQEQFKKRTKPLARRRHDNTLVLAKGENGEWTPHDMRRTGATMMQQLRVPLDTIDRCQNHVIKGPKTRRHYLHYDYRDEKMDAWKKLGDRIDTILSGGAEIIPLSRLA
jgi:integrase